MAINVKIDYNLDKTTYNNKDNLAWDTYPLIPSINAKKILIITEARSGSTFLGDLLQQSWPTFYSFEPLISMRSKNPRNDKSTSDEAIDLLLKLFECNYLNLTDHYLEPIFWKVPYLHWNLVMDKTVESDKLQFFNATTNEFVCRRCANRLIKTIRFGVEDFFGLLQKSKSDIDLVLLVRDPRGVMSSRYRMQWCINSPNCTDVEVLCERMRSDISAFIEYNKWLNGTIALVRYEDLSLNPIETAKRLFNKLNINFTIAVKLWLEEHTKTKDLLSNPHSTVRDSKMAPFSWFSRLTVDDVIEIQEYCSDVMENLGYKLIHNLDYDDNDTQTVDNYTLDQILDNKFPLSHFLP